jgi:cytochrome b561
VFATTLSGWVFASARGWSLSYFGLFQLPLLGAANRDLIRTINGWHQIAEWSLLVVVGFHVAAALYHLVILRDGVMRRMLP